MQCPACGGNVRVRDTRHDTNNNEILRERECIKCHRRFFTVEHRVDTTPYFLNKWCDISCERYRVKQRKEAHDGE